jgi:hypothetical protein
MLYTGIGRERGLGTKPLAETYSLSMKSPVAPESTNAGVALNTPESVAWSSSGISSEFLLGVAATLKNSGRCCSQRGCLGRRGEDGGINGEESGREKDTTLLAEVDDDERSSCIGSST